MSRDVPKDAASIEKSKENLRGLFPKGSTVWMVRRHVSRNGLVRDYGIICLGADNAGKIWELHPNFHVAVVLGLQLEPNEALDCVRWKSSGYAPTEICNRLSLALYGLEGHLTGKVL